MASREDAIDQFLGAAPSSPAPPSRPDVGKRKPMSKDQAIDAFLGQEDLPPAPPGAFKSVIENLKNLPKLATEGVPAAARAFSESQGGPTYGQELAKKYPASLYTPIPGFMDMVARALRLPQSFGKAVAELGPEQAKPLTEAGASQLPFLPWMSLRRPPPRPAVTPSEASPILRQQLALPPATRGVHVPSDVVEGQIIGDRSYRIVPPEALPPGPVPRGELPPHVDWRTSPPPPKMLTPGVPRKRGAIISGPGEPPQRPELPEVFQDVVPGAKMPDRIEAADLARMHRELVEELGVGKEGAKIAPESPTAPPAATPKKALPSEVSPVLLKGAESLTPGQAEGLIERWAKTDRRPSRGEMRAMRDLGYVKEHPDHTWTLTEDKGQPIFYRNLKPTQPEGVAPRFEATPEGQQGLIGGTPERTIPTSGLKAKAPQSLLSESPLFGGAKREPTQVGLEALDPQRAAVQEWLTDQLGSQAALALSEAKSAATIPPAVQRKLSDLGISPQDAFDVTKSAVPKADTMERLVAKSLGEERKALPPGAERPGLLAGFGKRPQRAQPTERPEMGPERSVIEVGYGQSRLDAINNQLSGAKGPIEQWQREALTRERDQLIEQLKDPDKRRAILEPKSLPFQRKGDYEHGQPSLADTDDAISVIQGYGKIKPSEDWRGEIARLPAWMKSKNGKTLEEMAAALEDTYGAALGTRQEIKQKLFDTLDSYSTLKANKKTRAAEAAAAEGEAAKAPPDPLTTEIKTDVPPSDVTVDPTDWKAMGPIERRSAIEFFRDALTDESGRLDLKAMAKALKRFRGQFPKETAVIKERPNSPVIAEVERWNTGLSDGLQMIADYAWWKRIRKMDPEALKDLEQRMVQTWDQGGRTQQSYNQAVAMAPPEVQAAMRHRARALQLENQSRRFFGLQDIPEQPGPYIPRKVDPESREAVSIGAGSLGRGAGPQTTVRGHGQERTFETFRQGERQGGGLEYEDPRNSILYREWEGIKLRATHRLFKNLEAKGTLFRDKNAAAAVAPTGRPWKVENAPGGEWWTPTEAEAKFLRQNLIESNRGPMTSLVGYANTLLRNPNLVNPAPHVVKNMAMKELLAQGPVSMSMVARDAVEYFRGTNPRLLREFKEAMPFSESGRASGEILGRELRGGPVTDAVRTAMRQLQHLNRPSQKVIFEWADPAMRYSLYKHYRSKGKDVYEAGNHAWVDLIRYGTRSERTDFWKAMPLNFFVPWRYGTFVSLMKQAKNHPVRTALLIGGVDYLREVRYRQSGRWTHLPWDYVFNPIAHLAQAKSAKEFATTLGSEATLTALFGPGGAFAASQMVDMLNDARGRGDYRRLANMFWGVGQLYGVAFEDIPQGQWGNALGGLLLGEHKALSYQPRRLGPGFGLIPESVLKDLPGMRKSRLVRDAEEMQQEREERIQKRQERQKDRPTPGIEERLKQSGYRF